MRLIPITPDVDPWYGMADILVCASDIESLPRTVLEAMAWETPVLATSVFGLPELIDDGETGWLCEPRDMLALARQGARPGPQHRPRSSARRSARPRVPWSKSGTRSVGYGQKIGELLEWRQQPEMARRRPGMWQRLSSAKRWGDRRRSSGALPGGAQHLVGLDLPRWLPDGHRRGRLHDLRPSPLPRPRERRDPGLVGSDPERSRPSRRWYRR